MRLSTVPLTADNVHRCAALWGGREALSSSGFASAMATVAQLLATERARGRVITGDEGEVRAFGCSAFVSRSCMDAILATPTQLFGTQVLLDPFVHKLVLDQSGIERGNAGEGLELLVLSQGYVLRASPPDAAEFYPILAAMMQAFIDTHRGYNVVRIVNEVFGDEGMQAINAAEAGGLEVRARFEHRLPSGRPLRSLCWTLTRDEAQRLSSLLLPMFLYARPRLRLTAAEQTLLRGALRGRTDRESSDTLGIPLTTVKSRWARIQARIEDELPELLAREASPGRGANRGAQIRHLILDYLRDHPSELTPYPRVPAATGQPSRTRVGPLRPR